MRPKIIIAVLLVGFIGLAGIFFLKHLTAPSQPMPPAVARQEAAPAATQISSSNATPVKTIAPLADAPVVKTISHAAADTNALAKEHKAYVQAEIDKLSELQANDDAGSLHAILADLTNSDKEIRAAAVESTIQFESRDAIPVLQDLAARTEDPGEKKALLDAVDFLALPTLTEAREQNRQAKTQNTAPPQDASPAPGQP
jgi:hypothetical protein